MAAIRPAHASRSLAALLLGALLALPLAACGEGGGGAAEAALDDEYGKPLLETPVDAGKADSADGLAGPRTSGLSADTEVWPVTRRWYEVSDEAGIAWEAGSGLTWDEKYAAWVDAMGPHDAATGSQPTFELETPWGKRLPAPTLECAETAMFLRATFASWYGLPFFLSAWSPTWGTMHFGHFGIVDGDGRRISGYPRFAKQYEDHTARLAGRTDEEIAAAWPRDEALRARALTSKKDDGSPFLGEGAYAGAYFDEIFLNKRVGHWMLRMLTNLGSIHLADARRNTFNLAPEAIRPGDVLLKRWQRQGIGHTLVIKTVEAREGGRLDVEAVFGSMPRIQPTWWDPNLTKSSLTASTAGGEGATADGEPYASLGGGLKRWRTPVSKSGRWYNIVPVANRDAWIDSADLATLAARPARFEELLGQLSPAEEREVLLQQIGVARENLQRHPSSCSNRTRREEAFDKLYALNEDAFGVDRAATDREHRTLEDYVFAELVYEQSKTCCWNSTTEAMFVLIMALNEQRVADETTGTCQEPLVFMARDGGYEAFRAFAEASGSADAWVAWSADESCPQAGVADDTETEHAWTPWCSL